MGSSSNELDSIFGYIRISQSAEVMKVLIRLTAQSVCLVQNTAGLCSGIGWLWRAIGWYPGAHDLQRVIGRVDWLQFSGLASTRLRCCRMQSQWLRSDRHWHGGLG